MEYSKIIFRGISTAFKKWVWGYPTYIKTADGLNLIPKCYLSYANDFTACLEVDRSTICIGTAINDKAGKRIFENDILTHPDDEGDVVLVSWNDKEARFEPLRYGYYRYIGENSQDVIDEGFSCLGVHDDITMSDLSIYDLIGNSIENPDLLNAK